MGEHPVPFAHYGHRRFHPGASASVAMSTLVHPGLDPALGSLLSTVKGAVNTAKEAYGTAQSAAEQGRQAIESAPAYAERAVASAAGQARAAMERGVQSQFGAGAQVPAMQQQSSIWASTGVRVGIVIVAGLAIFALVQRMR